MANPIQFIQQTRAEVAKIVWPTRREVLLTTVTVFIMAALTASLTAARAERASLRDLAPSSLPEAPPPLAAALALAVWTAFVIHRYWDEGESA